MAEKEDIGNRLRKWGESRYSNMADLASALKVSPQQLNSYLSGIRTPGNKTQNRLRVLGCDTIWLMTGNTKEELDEKLIAMRKRIAAEEMTKDVREIIDFLRGEGIETAKPLKEVFEKYRKMREIVTGASELQLPKTKTKKQRR